MKSLLCYGAQCHLLVFIDMKTRSFGRPPYVEVYAKMLMQASLQHIFTYTSTHC